MKAGLAAGAAFVVLGLTGLGAGAALADKPPAPPGQDPCSHGRTGKPCRPDPQPEHGKDCEHHGNKGGVNEDHCAPVTTEPPTTTTTTTPPACPNCGPGQQTTPTPPGGGAGGGGTGTTPTTPAVPTPGGDTTTPPGETPPGSVPGTPTPDDDTPAKRLIPPPPNAPPGAPPTCPPGGAFTGECGVQGSG